MSRILVIFPIAALACLTAACDDDEPPSGLQRLEPVMRGDLDHVVSSLPDGEGFALTISPSEKLTETLKARVSVRGDDGRPIPFHLFDCHDTNKRSLDRSPAVTITPGTVRFCAVFVPSAEQVRRIVLHPEGRAPFDLYREGDPLGPTPGVVVRPPEVDPRLP